MGTIIDNSAILIAQTGPLDGKRWTLNRTVIIGRDASCDIVIPDRQVSRQHARIYSNSQGAFLQDLNSKNGTYFNGERILKETLLQDGDVIQIAYIQHFLYVSSDATLPLSDTNLLEPELVYQISHETLQKKRLVLDLRSRRVWINLLDENNKIIKKELIPPLSVSQFQLLNILYQNLGKVVSRQEIIEAVWQEKQAFEISAQALDALIRRLRHRLAEIDPAHEYIITVRGHGLILDNPELTPNE